MGYRIKDGIKISDWKYKYEYFDNGQEKKESSFQDGKEDGESTTWFEDGGKKRGRYLARREYLITNRWKKMESIIKRSR
ncbi:MAG: hypothetical protein CM1200mP10_22420 [Candidatus Neomarinimicrobiota bacterium]|nr:MAG: hypothetical protein CM1200mP10_22420 [Candidatus Neomarinimicrobiota bacterium]